MDQKVVLGILKDPKTIETENQEIQEIKDFQGRAMWSWLRLQYGRSVDDRIKDVVGPYQSAYKLGQVTYSEYKELRDQALEVFVFTKINENKQRVVQYILQDDIIKSVASTKHLLVPPEEVKKMVETILSSKEIQAKTDKAMAGLVVEELEYKGIKLGYHFDFGDIYTRRAISVSSYARILSCLNPLTWAGIGNFGRFGIGRDYERILRIKKISELRPRIESAIEGSSKNIDRLKDMVEYAKTNNIDPREAKVILGAFSKSFGIGDKTIDELLSRVNWEDKTTWGMSQASSWIARHGETFRKTPEGQTDRSRQNMATVGGSCLLIKEPKVTFKKAREWLNGKFPKSLPEWLEDLS